MILTDFLKEIRGGLGGVPNIALTHPSSLNPSFVEFFASKRVKPRAPLKRKK